GRAAAGDELAGAHPSVHERFHAERLDKAYVDPELGGARAAGIFPKMLRTDAEEHRLADMITIPAGRGRRQVDARTVLQFDEESTVRLRQFRRKHVHAGTADEGRDEA